MFVYSRSFLKCLYVKFKNKNFKSGCLRTFFPKSEHSLCSLCSLRGKERGREKGRNTFASWYFLKIKILGAHCSMLINKIEYLNEQFHKILDTKFFLFLIKTLCESKANSVLHIRIRFQSESNFVVDPDPFSYPDPRYCT